MVLFYLLEGATSIGVRTPLEGFLWLLAAEAFAGLLLLFLGFRSLLSIVQGISRGVRWRSLFHYKWWTLGLVLLLLMMAVSFPSHRAR